MSDLQLAANRNNALKSTGPKTAAGKALSSMNALKYGLLAEQVVVQGLHIQESADQFEALRQEMKETLAPVGAVEEMLVDRIVTTQWRLRRTLIAETGEIALSVDKGSWSRANLDAISPTILDGLEDRVISLMKSVRGVDLLIYVLRKVLMDVSADGQLTAAAMERVLKMFGNRPNIMTHALQEFRAHFASAKGGKREEIRRQQRDALVAYLERELRQCQEHRVILLDREEREEESRQAGAVLPSAAVLEKIMRYETTLERQLYRAMNQLERLQRLRGGERVPPPVTVDVSHNRESVRELND